MEHLFTEKGKKYAVINKVIGTGQIICREVMINKETGEEVLRNDVETISENLLYNSPVESYYEKRERELQLSFKKLDDEYDQKRNVLYRMIRNQEEVNKDFFKIRQKLFDFLQTENEPFIQLIDFLTGNFEYAYIGSYKAKILSKEELFKEMERSDGMKTLVPRYASNAEESRRLFITSYSDGSGSTHDAVYLYKTFEEAQEKFKQEFVKRFKNSNYLSSEDFEKTIEYGIDFDIKEIEKKIKKSKESLEQKKIDNKKQLDYYQSDLNKWKEVLKKAKS